MRRPMTFTLVITILLAGLHTDRIRAMGEIVEVAQDFSIEYYWTTKIVKNLRRNETYVLHQTGTPPPDFCKIPAGVKIFEIPVNNASVMDSTVAHFIAMLNVTNKVGQATGYVVDPCLQKIARGHDVLATQPDAKLSPQSQPIDIVFSFAADPSNKKVAFTATADPGVLNRAEWIKFVGAFFNREAEAAIAFDEVAKNYKARVQNNTQGPLVAWTRFQSGWSPSNLDAFFIDFAAYKLEYTIAGGGRHLDESTVANTPNVIPVQYGYEIRFDPNTNKTAAVKTLKKLLAYVDVLIDETYQPDVSAYSIDTFYETYGMTEDHNKFPFAKNQNVYRLDKTIAVSTAGTDVLDWFDTAVARPDLVLQDIQTALGTSETKEHTRIWLRNLSKGESVTKIVPEDCPNFVGCLITPGTSTSTETLFSIPTSTDEVCSSPAKQ